MADEEDKAPFKTSPPPDRDESLPPQYGWWQRFWVGALVGAAVGCLSRPAVVAAFWQVPGVVGLVLASCVIGALIGAFAGGVGGLIPMPMLGGALGRGIGRGHTEFFLEIVNVPDPDLENWENDEQVRKMSKRTSYQNAYVLNTSDDIRIFFKLDVQNNEISIIDIAKPSRFENVPVASE